LVKYQKINKNQEEKKIEYFSMFPFIKHLKQSKLNNIISEAQIHVMKIYKERQIPTIHMAREV
jgi:hypothetical protein